MKIDLHCHTTLSDGSLGIEEVIAQAKKTGIDVLSITDHDTLSSYSRAAVLADRYGVKIIQGVEMSAWDKQRNQKVHILCYAPKKPDRLEGLCLKCCEIRKSCSKEMIDKVRKLYPNSNIVAIDTEFIRLYTYRPILSIVQLKKETLNVLL